MSPITADFQSDLPLHPKAAELLHTFFERGWSDPNRLHHRAASLRILISEAKEEIAAALGCAADELEFVGELGFGFWSALSGLLNKEPRREIGFIHSAVDRQVVHAFAREHQARGGSVTTIPVSSNGECEYLLSNETSGRRVVSWQATNRENGVIQSPPMLSVNDDLFADMTAAIPGTPLPENWSVALWDPQRFAGPQGIAILAISKNSLWKSPLPPMDNKRTFGSYSKPLLLATAVSLTNYLSDFRRSTSMIDELHETARSLISQKIADIKLLDASVKRDKRYLALGIRNVVGEELVRRVEARGFLIDAGSACGSGPLSPSHVFDAMGWEGLAHIRLSLKTDSTKEQLVELIGALSVSVEELRS